MSGNKDGYGEFCGDDGDGGEDDVDWMTMASGHLASGTAEGQDCRPGVY